MAEQDFPWGRGGGASHRHLYCVVSGRQVFLFFPILEKFLFFEYNFFYGNFEPHFAQHDILL